MKPKLNPAIMGGISLALISAFFIASVAADNQPAANNPPPLAVQASKAELPPSKIVVGVWQEKIVEPRCVELKDLFRVTAAYKEIEKRKIDPGTGRYWIFMSMAAETVRNTINEYAQEKQVNFICCRETLLPLLKKMPELKGQPEEKLLKRFDLTEAIADFALEKNRREEEKAKAGRP